MGAHHGIGQLRVSGVAQASVISPVAGVTCVLGAGGVWFRLGASQPARRNLD
jgi:hypothetical protein